MEVKKIGGGVVLSKLITIFAFANGAVSDKHHKR